jgi:stringent starvation protein B
MGNELIEFSARFGGVARQISLPITNVYALYARETGHGMTFDIEGGKPSVQTRGEVETVASNAKPPAALPAPVAPEPPNKPSGPGKPTLRRIK